MAGLFLAANGLSDWYFVLYLLLFTTLFLAWQWLSWLLLRLRAPESAPGTATGKAAFSMRLLWVTVRPSLVTAGVFVTLLGFWLLPMIQEGQPACLIFFHPFSGANDFSVAIFVNCHRNENGYILIFAAPVTFQVDSI